MARVWGAGSRPGAGAKQTSGRFAERHRPQRPHPRHLARTGRPAVGVAGGRGKGCVALLRSTRGRVEARNAGFEDHGGTVGEGSLTSMVGA